MSHKELILILDFGSQYSQLIARRVRELGVYSELRPYNLSIDTIATLKPAGIILSGGPSSVYDPDAPLPPSGIFTLGIPILGICYGLQVIAHGLGGEVDRSIRREYGSAEILIDDRTDLLKDIEPVDNAAVRVWMSHGDALTMLPPGFTSIAHSRNSPICAVKNVAMRIYGVQFHPEVTHTHGGKQVLKNFLFIICACTGGWNAGSFIEDSLSEIKNIVGKEHVLCALSGGVDSTVLAVLLQKAVRSQLYCIHINNGLMRQNESECLVELYNKQFHFNLQYLDAGKTFLAKLKDVNDPERKRKIIGRLFIKLFEKEAGRLNRIGYLAQGTLYPDVIESVSFRGPSHTIKSHHNVGGLPEKMRLKLLEPLRELFKDEVREVGKVLGVPAEILNRHPFPGPGLAVRIIGNITSEKLQIVRSADAIFIEEIRMAGLYESVWQAFAVLLPVQTVGVMGDRRTYENVIALRAVTSVDGMTADCVQFSPAFLAKVSGRIINEVRGVNRVVYDISSKPPSTIEWE
jgi:GMP synthase (glutamine-hydrolysing)